MKLIKEHIKFERGLDPKQSMDIGLFKSLESLGIRFNFGWRDGEGEIEKQKFINNINEMNKFIQKLISVGVDPEGMHISHSDTVEIKVVRVMNGNRVIHECISEEDAKMLIDACLALSIEGHPDQYHIDNDGEKIVYVYAHPWLDNLLENRRKYMSIK
jgi:hypothetical protein